MIRVSLDTCAIIDFCQRYYPQEQFPGLWDSVQSTVTAGFVSFEVAEGVLKETEDRLEIQGIDKKTFEEFERRLKIKTVLRSDYQASLTEAQQELLKTPQYATCDYVSADIPDMHAIALCKLLGKDGIVLTSEQRMFGVQNPARIIRKAKIPNACDILKADCLNWAALFARIAVTV